MFRLDWCRLAVNHVFSKNEQSVQEKMWAVAGGAAVGAVRRPRNAINSLPVGRSSKD
jgi:hypothetical protein